jgi:hypothetical protein
VRVTTAPVRLCRSLIAYEGGHRLAGALLHYMADRLQHEQRWTDALKQVPSTQHLSFRNLGTLTSVARYAATYADDGADPSDQWACRSCERETPCRTVTSPFLNLEV